MASGNGRLVQWLCDDLYSLIRLFRYRAAALRPEPQRTHSEHRAIVAALQARDADGAERLMREHVRGSRERLIGHLRRSSASAARGRSPTRRVILYLRRVVSLAGALKMQLNRVGRGPPLLHAWRAFVFLRTPTT